jgi:protein TonB
MPRSAVFRTVTTLCGRCPRFTAGLAAVLTGSSLALALAACSVTVTSPSTVSRIERPAANTSTLDAYKVQAARHIVEANPDRVSVGHPQAMLRSVVVVSFVVDRAGRVAHSAVYRTNGDDLAESTALASLRRASPLPPPPAALLDRKGEIELMEDWLFNDDGRFQLHSIATSQTELEN